MQKVINQFVTVSRNGIVQTIGKSTIPTPKIKYDGRTTKWYEDKPKVATVRNT